LIDQRVVKTEKRVYTLRLNERVFRLVENKAEREYRSIANCIEFIILRYFNQVPDSVEEDET